MPTVWNNNPVVTRLHHLSNYSRIVSDACREVNVKTIPKKGGHSNPTDLQLQLSLSFFCKVLQRIINKQLIHYLEDHSLLNDRQYGLRSSRSTADLLTYVTHLGESQPSASIWPELSIGVDTVRFSSKVPTFGLLSKLWNWVTAYLHQRRIRILCDGVVSVFGR